MFDQIDPYMMQLPNIFTWVLKKCLKFFTIKRFSASNRRSNMCKTGLEWCYGRHQKHAKIKLWGAINRAQALRVYFDNSFLNVCLNGRLTKL